MRSKRLLHKVLVLLALVPALFALAACQYFERLEEEESTLEAEETQPAPSPIAPETPVEEPTAEVPTRAATDMEEYISMTEFFSVKVPAGWSSEEIVPGGAIVMANSQAARNRYDSGTAVESGDFVLNIGFLPYRLLETNELRSLNFQFDASPDVFLQSLMPMFHVAEDLVISDPELVSLSDEREAGLMTVSAEGQEGMVLMFVAGDRVIALVSTVAFPGEMDQFKEIAYSVAADVVFSGAQDALYGALLGG
jgi:hypothetical protein